jgi:signal transduction histidine kinase
MRLFIRPGMVIHRKIAWLLSFSVISLAFVSWLIYVSKRNIERTHLSINQTYEITGIIRQIMLVVSGSGADAYHYLSAGDRDAAARLLASHGMIDGGIEFLGQQTRENHDQQEHISLLRKFLLEKRILENGLYPVLPIGDSARKDAERRVEMLNGRIKTLLNRMLQGEEALLAIRNHQDEEANGKTAIGFVIGRTLGFLFVVIILLRLNKDISRRKATQERLVRAIQEAHEAKQLQEQFLANMSHEIRTPMNGIKGMTDLLLGTPLSEKQHELAGIIKSSAGNLLVIINDILDFSKIKAGKLNIEKIDFSVQEVLNSAGAIFEHRITKKGLVFRTELDPAIPRRLIGDPHRLNQVLINLIGNAVKFTARGQIHLKVALQERREDGVLLLFTITDTGIGIPPDSLPFIFDNFSQAGQDISRRYGGTGLGLTICKQLLQLQGGDVTASSKVGKGSVFNFYLPYGYSEEPPLNGKTGAKSPGSAGGRNESKVINGEGLKSGGHEGKEHEEQEEQVVQERDYSKVLIGKRFLVAEDNEINQKLIDYVLKKAGGSVELAGNGAEAIRCLEKGNYFDLIIMDLQMPEMDGYAATHYIRNELHLLTPIIAMTATAMKGEQRQCLESGMNEYMTKPFEFDDLYKRIGHLLS